MFISREGATILTCQVVTSIMNTLKVHEDDSFLANAKLNASSRSISQLVRRESWAVRTTSLLSVCLQKSDMN